MLSRKRVLSVRQKQRVVGKCISLESNHRLSFKQLWYMSTKSSSVPGSTGEWNENWDFVQCYEWLCLTAVWLAEFCLMALSVVDHCCCVSSRQVECPCSSQLVKCAVDLLSVPKESGLMWKSVVPHVKKHNGLTIYGYGLWESTKFFDVVKNINLLFCKTSDEQ